MVSGAAESADACPAMAQVASRAVLVATAGSRTYQGSRIESGARRGADAFAPLPGWAVVDFAGP